jgi:hypothetical protein
MIILEQNKLEESDLLKIETVNPKHIVAIVFYLYALLDYAKDIR